MAKKRQSYELGLIEAVIDLAWASPIAGNIVSTVLIVLAWIFGAAEHSPDPIWAFAGPLLSLIFLFTGIAGLLVCAVAALRDALFRHR